jgi:lipopolysaccharide export LptBFGC system permease protein LptF
VIIFFGSFIFGSLRDSSPASRVVIAFVGGFSYKVIQDFSISFFISFGYPVLIGVVMPAIVLLISSLFLYKRI